jgi:preprotein translocase subunit SecG
MPGWMKWAIALLIGFAIIALGFRLSWGAWILRPFFVLNCLVLIVVVLLQSGKAADLAGAFGGAGSQTAFGPRGAANVLSKATTWCAVMFMLCSFAMVLRIDKSVGGSSILERVSQPAPKPAPLKTTPAPVTPPASAPASTPAAPASAPSSAPSTTPTSAPQSSAPASSKPAPAQPAPAQPKKP